MYLISTNVLNVVLCTTCPEGTRLEYPTIYETYEVSTTHSGGIPNSGYPMKQKTGCAAGAGRAQHDVEEPYNQKIHKTLKLEIFEFEFLCLPLLSCCFYQISL